MVGHEEVQHSGITPPEENGFKVESVRFPNKMWDMAANIIFPKDFDESKKYPIIICGHPISSCKEQTSGQYAQRLVDALGCVAFVFDASFQGESGGEPRFIEDPTERVEDFRCAVDYVLTLKYVDEERVGALGVCGSGAYGAAATMTDHRIKAYTSIVGTSYGRMMREGQPAPHAGAALEMIEAVGKQRTAEARGGEPYITGYIPRTREERDEQGITERDVYNAVEYYRTPRAQHKNSPDKLRLSGLLAMMSFDPFHLADQLFTQPLLVICGDVPGAFGSFRDSFELFNKAASAQKEILVCEGADHYDLYDNVKYMEQAMAKMKPFYEEHLVDLKGKA